MDTNELTIGLDLGDRRHAVCVLDQRGAIIAEEAIPNTRAALERFAGRFGGATVIMETGTRKRITRGMKIRVIRVIGGGDGYGGA
jgi:hypothetical protein